MCREEARRRTAKPLVADAGGLVVDEERILDEELRAKKKADLIMDWLLDQDEVEDVYLTDDEMVSLIRQW